MHQGVVGRKGRSTDGLNLADKRTTRDKYDHIRHFSRLKTLRLLVNFREGGSRDKIMTKLEEMVGEPVLGCEELITRKKLIRDV